jgi:FlaA1/EpsC-like NDP-sugar epimerase
MGDGVSRLLGGFAASALALPRLAKRVLVVAVDVGLCVLSVWLAFYLREGAFSPLSAPLLVAAGVSVALAIPIFVVSGLYRAIFRYSGLPAMLAMVRAMLLYGVLFAALFAFYGVAGVPRTVGLIQPLLLLVLVGASRAAARVWLGGLYLRQVGRLALPQVLIYGAGSAGRQLAAAMANSHELRVVGFLDDDDRLHGHVLNGLPIYNPVDLAEVLTEVAVTDVLLALPSVSRQRRNAILAALSPHRLAVRTLPGLSDIASGKVNLSDVRELDIDDLLGREPVKPNGLLLNRNTQHKTVLVTGAGGSIGSELCRQILKTGPKQVLLVEMSEFALYQIHQELQVILAGVAHPVTGVAVEIVPLLASVCDEVRMHEIMDTWKPHTVYHAAAYKHVPLVEHNPAEGVRNNVWGTRVCAEAAARHGVRNFVLISTDKAVRPTNIMGATKRLAEMVLQALAESGADAPTCFSMVRFGNVLGSSGSVVPLFREQIKNSGPITLTHADITRYFMTIPEAAQLVIQAGAMGVGGDVFVLDMGQPVRIYDLARRMVTLSGLTLKDETQPEGDIEIVVTGLRPGEKLYEELLIGDNPKPTQHARIMKAHEAFLAWPRLQEQLDVLGVAVSVNDVPLIRRLLQQLVPGYDPSGEVVDWVHLAHAREAEENA